jgi:hypothetical protein
MAAINQLTLAPGAVAPDIVKGSIFFIGNESARDYGHDGRKTRRRRDADRQS